MPTKEFLINAVQLIEIDGSVNVPTAVSYDGRGEPLIGSAALAALRTGHIAHTNFKVELGNLEPGSTKQRIFSTPAGEKKSAAGIADVFLHGILAAARDWLADYDIDISRDTSILLAEPLAMQAGLVASGWLGNYRQNLDRLLRGKGFVRIDFLPEPFAVFQYYRYGYRHPLVAERKKQNALVIDFGGGTFDVCIIETTKEGDISQSGRNSRPLAAASEAIGGYFINRLIAEHLFQKVLSGAKDGKQRLAKGLDIYQKYRKGLLGLSTVSPEYRDFVSTLTSTIDELEDIKLALSKSITDWRLNADLSFTIPVSVPSDPFAASSRRSTVSLSGTEFRELFVTKVWEVHLRPLVRRALQRGKDELSGAPISVVLLSGGSANIGWLRQLLQTDCVGELGDVDVLQLPDFQEVVAKGLAVECARRFHNDEGDFSSVTYNRLCLILDSDGLGHQLKRFVPRLDGLPNVADHPGVLLPSASIIRRLFDRPLRWRVRLDRPPRRHLSYYFLRSSFDPDDLENRQNVEETKIYSPPDVPFDGALHVELTIRQDGTATPRFIYKAGRTAAETVSVDGRPFYLDMTYGQTEARPSGAYLGLDFGTSNSSISYVDRASVNLYERRSAENSWLELSDLVSTLPYPVATPLAKYLGQHDATNLVRWGRDFCEAALAMAAYVAFSEFCASGRTGTSRILKGFPQRSAGPLWAFLQTCLRALGSKALIAAPFNELLTGEFRTPLEEAIAAYTQDKHGKLDDGGFDTLRSVRILANVSQRAYSPYVFGYFQNVQKQRFGKECSGLFRCAHGSSIFLEAFAYEGNSVFSPDEAFLVDPSNGVGLRLQPLVFWDHCDKHPDVDDGHCYFFDKSTSPEGRFSFKAAGYACAVEVGADNQYRELATMIASARDEDPQTSTVGVGSLRLIQR